MQNAERQDLTPLGTPLDAVVRVPGSKSATNRALVLAALAEGTTTLSGALVCDDSRYMVEGLSALGFEIRQPQGESGPTEVVGRGGVIPASRAKLFVGNAGTAARFLTAVAALGEGSYEIDGSSRMRERPIGDLVTALRQLGSQVSCTDGCPPVAVKACGLNGRRVSVSSSDSSQFLSALMMVAPYANGGMDIEVTGELTSRPYVELTVDMMRDFGVSVTGDGQRHFSISPGRYKARTDYSIEADASSASYPFAAAAIIGGRVRVEGISYGSRQGDIGLLRVLETMGCAVSSEGNWTEVSRRGPLTGVDVDMRDMPDVAPTLAVIAPFATTPTTIRGIASARRKECDRVAAIASELSGLGATVEERRDGMTIFPCDTLHGGVVRTYDDHRIAMAFALIGLRIPGVEIENPGCVSKTFPSYFEMLQELRG